MKELLLLQLQWLQWTQVHIVKIIYTQNFLIPIHFSGVMLILQLLCWVLLSMASILGYGASSASQVAWCWWFPPRILLGSFLSLLTCTATCHFFTGLQVHVRSKFTVCLTCGGYFVFVLLVTSKTGFTQLPGCSPLMTSNAPLVSCL